MGRLVLRFSALSLSLGVEVGCLDCVALGSEIGIALEDVPVEVAACVTCGDVALNCLDVDIGCLDCVRAVLVDSLSDGDVGFSCLDVDIKYIDYIHIPDVNFISDVVVTFFCLEVRIRWMVCVSK